MGLTREPNQTQGEKGTGTTGKTPAQMPWWAMMSVDRDLRLTQANSQLGRPREVRVAEGGQYGTFRLRGIEAYRDLEVPEAVGES